MARRGIVLFSSVLALACAAQPADPDSAIPGTDSGPPADGAWTPPACGEPETVCPPSVPYPTGLCEGALHCEYLDDVADCASGRWTVQPRCREGLPGMPCIPPLVEDCDAPFSGTLSGATVTMGPLDEDRAFADGELVPVIFGPQGGAMIRWTLRVDGVAVPPACVRANVRIQLDAMPPYAAPQPVTLHCGDSLGIFAVLPDPCDDREYTVTMIVDVDGIGSTTARLRIMGGGCMLTG